MVLSAHADIASIAANKKAAAFRPPLS